MRSRQAKVEAEVKVVQSTSVIETFTLKPAPMLGAQSQGGPKAALCSVYCVLSAAISALRAAG
jgi:hypothetical protein